LSWVLWAVILVAQNFAFTFVSRARNSGSIGRHAFASVFSNGVWFLGQTILFRKMLDLMTGKLGVWMAVLTAVFYTACTMAGSLLAHLHALRSEKGDSAVGASRKYAQIPAEEWAWLWTAVAEMQTTVSKLSGWSRRRGEEA
jgi:hypothetical protein